MTARIKPGQHFMLPSGRVVVVVDVVGNDAHCVYKSRMLAARDGSYDLHVRQTWLEKQIRVARGHRRVA